MKVGNRPLPVSARVPNLSAPHPSPARRITTRPDAGGDRVDLSREASEALETARAGLLHGTTREALRELVATTNREASRTASPDSLQKLLALVP